MLRLSRILIAGALLAVAAATPVAAQGSIDGVLFDSLRAMQPIAGAEVVLLSDGRSVTTDRRGRFRFTDVAAGEHRVGYGALWLDSIGAPAPIAAVAVPARGRVRVELATLPRRRIELAACATELASDQGLLVGEVRDATAESLASDVVVEARWSERLLGRDMNETREVATVDTTDASGRFTLCGVPPKVQVTVIGTHADGRATEPILVNMDVPIAVRDLKVGEAAARILVRGRVTGPSGEPMPRASVLASLSQQRPVMTDSLGEFAVVIPARSGQLLVRALGYNPALVAVSPHASEVSVGDIAMSPTGAVLDTMRIVASAPRTLEEMGFEERRRVGLGAFVDEAYLSTLPRVTATSITMAMPPWIRATSGRFPIFVIRRGMGFCTPRFFVDGYDWGDRTEAIDIYNIVQLAKRVEAYKAGFAPPRYNDFNGCGAVVIWTR